MFTMIAVILAVLNSGERYLGLSQTCDNAPLTWIRYLRLLSNAATDEPKEMEIVIRVCCDSSKENVDGRLWHLGSSSGQSSNHATDKSVVYYEDFETHYFSCPYRGGEIYTPADPPRSIYFSTRLSTLQLITAPADWNFGDATRFLQGAPTERAQPTTLTITNIEVKVDGVALPGEQLQIPLGRDHKVRLVPQNNEPSPVVEPSVNGPHTDQPWGVIF
jgi:hypothetical protein